VTRINYADASNSAGLLSYFQWPIVTIMPLWNARGRWDTGIFSQLTETLGDTTHALRVTFQNGWQSYALTPPGPPQSWLGSVLEDEHDQTGTFYRRARVYDPATGQFTQEDPLRLGGGLNSYGFVNGDPVNYDDPFGLRPCSEIRSSIQSKLKGFMHDFRKYHFFHGKGGSNTGHYKELKDWQTGLKNDTRDYHNEKCDDDDDHDGFRSTLEQAEKYMSAPIPNPRIGPVDNQVMPGFGLPTLEQFPDATAVTGHPGQIAPADVMLLTGLAWLIWEGPSRMIPARDVLP
jgi:RHS repeat-associated protein